MNNDFKKGYMEFADRLFAETVRKNINGNVLISPYSMFTLMAMLSDGANGNSRNQIINAISNGSADNSVLSSLISLSEQLKNGGNAKLHIANALITKPEYGTQIRKKYTDLLKNTYDADVFSSGNIIDSVNEWTNDKTLGMIPEILDPEAQIDICLIDAIAFVGKWMSQYENRHITEDDTFMNVSGETEQATMLFSSEHKWLHKDGLEGFVKPYKSGKYDFMAVIPESSETDINTVMPSVKMLGEMYRHAQSIKTNVSMPEFKFDCCTQMKDVLEPMGISDVFQYGTADLGNMIDNPNVFVDKIIHKTHIENDREGTKAAAASAACMEVGCAIDFEETKYVRLDRPFVFSIMNSATAIPVFVGVLNSLKQ